MNLYLTHLASHLPQIRQQLDITQEDLSKLMGISRPTLVKVENEHEKFTHAMAACLYVALTAQLEKDKRLIEELRGDKYSTLKKLEGLLVNSKNLSTLSASTMRSSIMTMNVLPAALKEKGIGLISAGFKGAKNLVKRKKDVEEEVSTEDYLDEDLNKYAVEYLNFLEKEISEKEKFCLHVFQLEHWSSLSFIENIQKHNL